MTYPAKDISETLSNHINLKLYTLLLQDQYSGRELSTLLDITPEELSEHLNNLRQMNLIESRETCGSEYFQARSNPRELALQAVRSHGNDDWDNLRTQARSSMVNSD